MLTPRACASPGRPPRKKGVHESGASVKVFHSKAGRGSGWVQQEVLGAQQEGRARTAAGRGQGWGGGGGAEEGLRKVGRGRRKKRQRGGAEGEGAAGKAGDADAGLGAGGVDVEDEGHGRAAKKARTAQARKPPQQQPLQEPVRRKAVARRGGGVRTGSSSGESSRGGWVPAHICSSGARGLGGAEITKQARTQHASQPPLAAPPPPEGTQSLRGGRQARTGAAVLEPPPPRSARAVRECCGHGRIQRIRACAPQLLLFVVTWHWTLCVRSTARLPVACAVPPTSVHTEQLRACWMHPQRRPSAHAHAYGTHSAQAKQQNCMLLQ